MALEIEPAAGLIALQFLDHEDDEPKSTPRPGQSTAEPDQDEAILAICVGVGKPAQKGQTMPCAKGDTVLVRAYARHGIRVGDDVVLCESYCVVGIVTD